MYIVLKLACKLARKKHRCSSQNETIFNLSFKQRRRNTQNWMMTIVTWRKRCLVLNLTISNNNKCWKHCTREVHALLQDVCVSQYSHLYMHNLNYNSPTALHEVTSEIVQESSHTNSASGTTQQEQATAEGEFLNFHIWPCIIVCVW